MGIIESLSRRYEYKWRVCKECKDKGATVRYNPFNGAIYKTCGYASKRKGSKRKRLPLKTRRLLSRYKHAVHVNNGTMYIDIDFAVRFMNDPHLQAPKLIELYHHLMGGKWFITPKNRGETTRKQHKPHPHYTKSHKQTHDHT